MKKDEQAMQRIQLGFQKETQLKELQEMEKQKIHDTIRQTFKQRQLQNYLQEKNIGLLQQNEKLSTKSADLQNQKNYFQACRFAQSQRKFEETMKTLTDKNKSQYINILSKPHQFQFPTHLLNQHNDFKGLFIGEIDDKKATQIDNCYVQKMLENKLTKNNLTAIKESRPSTQTSQILSLRPKTELGELDIRAGAKFYRLKQSILKTEENVIIDEMNEFDKRYAKSHKKNRKEFIGFPLTALDDPRNFISNTQVKPAIGQVKKFATLTKFDY